MPNTFIKPEVIVATALGLLQREVVLPRLVHLNGFGDFAGAKGDTVSIRVPARTKARTKELRATGAARNIVMDTLSETKVDVTLDTDVYNAIPITDEELSLDIKDFGQQILAPQVTAIGEGLEDGVAAAIEGAAYWDGSGVGQGPGEIEFGASLYDGFVDARKVLGLRNVPVAQRVAVVGAEVEARLLKEPLFHEADKSGSDSALRDAQIGRVAGFDIVVSNAIDPSAAYVFHKSAFAMVTRAPAKPDGVPFGATQSFQGLAMRWIRDYSFIDTTDRSLVNTYVGYGTITDATSDEVATKVLKRAVKLTLPAAPVTP